MVNSFDNKVDEAYNNGIKPYLKAIKSMEKQVLEARKFKELSAEIDRKIETPDLGR